MYDVGQNAKAHACMGEQRYSLHKDWYSCAEETARWHITYITLFIYIYIILTYETSCQIQLAKHSVVAAIGSPQPQFV